MSPKRDHTAPGAAAASPGTAASAPAEELRRTKERLEFALRGANDGIWDWDLRTSAAYYSPRWKAMLGYAEADLPGGVDTWRMLVHPDDTGILLAAITDLMGGRSDTIEVEFRMRHKSGDYRHVLSRAFVVRDPDGTATRLVGTHVDITDRKEAEARLAATASLLRAPLESTADGILVIDCAGRVSTYNQRFVDLWRIPTDVLGSGNDEALLASVLEQLTDPEQFLAKVRALYRDVEASSFDVLSFKDGRVFERYSQPQRLGPDVVGRVWSFRDVTEAKRLEESRRRSQKLEALGTLAGGIAHDFNNILTAIAGNARLAIADVTPTHPAHTSLVEITKATTRATELVRRILTFSRPDAQRRATLQLSPVVEEALQLVRATLPPIIQIRSAYGPDIPTVVADAGQVHQLVVNLATNAAHAIGPHRGTITVELNTVDTGATGGPPPDLPAGRYARLTVHDDGCGMDRATLDRIFDPFFTTKPTGKGTGLGLSVVHGIMTSHGGAVTAESQPGTGTTFRLYFPAAAAADVPAPAPSAPPAPGRGQRVLYIDDDEALVFLVTRTLTRLGYRVTGVHDPTAALTQFYEAPERFDVVVTDIAMPLLSGFDVAQAMRTSRPDLPIVMTSGHVRPEDRDAAAQLGILAVIPKPDTVSELATILHAALDKLDA